MLFSIKVMAGLACLLLSNLSILAEPLSRADVIELALENNPAVNASHAVWKTEQARALQAWAPPPPELELEYEGLSSALDFGD